MSARPIGEILAPILAKARRMATVQALINEAPNAERKKGLIIALYELEGITAYDAQLLIEAYQLETA